MKKLTLIRGLPGSAKSTLAKMLKSAEGDNIHLEADMYFINEYGEYKFDISKIGSAHYWCQKKTSEYLRANFSVIVSNTFTTTKELKPYFKIASDFGIIPNVILCQNNFGSIHSVPEETMKKMKERFQYDISSLFESYTL